MASVLYSPAGDVDGEGADLAEVLSPALSLRPQELTVGRERFRRVKGTWYLGPDPGTERTFMETRVTSQ